MATRPACSGQRRGTSTAGGVEANARRGRVGGASTHHESHQTASGAVTMIGFAAIPRAQVTVASTHNVSRRCG